MGGVEAQMEMNGIVGSLRQLRAHGSRNANSEAQAAQPSSSRDGVARNRIIEQPTARGTPSAPESAARRTQP
eukprot:8072423-Alexandrium_andersonii.AAC.1